MAKQKNPKFMQPMNISNDLAAVVGKGRLWNPPVSKGTCRSEEVCRCGMHDSNLTMWILITIVTTGYPYHSGISGSQ